ncbi:carbohydrate kinase [Luteitalea sp. TBR-22]|uniref:FGGY-family carbohydrate kinase n=1 Tax=Luteitalea sp. TBR-22 TaxID=2802971 RepID=UPI001AF481BB|nr:FGGY-family carbohydrate kinase [Luteitalea sp. TBR-22]BCS35636.1 carbohydrate kinase [Luteitalea sp. TBR-22]
MRTIDKIEAMSREVVLGIDVGTSGVRVAAVDRALQARAMAAVPMPPPAQADGRSRQAPATWWAATREALARLDLSGLVVRAIAVDGTSGTILPVAADGTPLDDASMYDERAPGAAVEAVAAVAPDDTAARSSASPLARALAWGDRQARLLHQADWIAAQFTGRLGLTDENNALKTGYDPVRRAWPDWIAGTGLDMTRLPAVVPAGTAVGHVRADLATQLDFPDDVVIVTGTTDGCAAFLASGASVAGDGVTSLGTTLTLKLLSDRPVVDASRGVYSHRLGDRWLAGGASNSGGAVLLAHFTRERLVELSALLAPDPPTGLDYYPLCRPGERFPINDASLPPRLSPRPSDDATFLKAMLEGMAAIEARGYEALASLGSTPLRTMRTVGGGAGNAAWTGIRTRHLGVPMVAVDSEHAAVGVARLAWQGIGHAC